jgi:hypothetical protein
MTILDTADRQPSAVHFIPKQLIGKRIAPCDKDRADLEIGRYAATGKETPAILRRVVTELIRRIEAGKIRGKDPRPAMVSYLQHSVLAPLDDGRLEEALAAYCEGFFDNAVPYDDNGQTRLLSHSFMKETFGTTALNAAKMAASVALAEMLTVEMEEVEIPPNKPNGPAAVEDSNPLQPTASLTPGVLLAGGTSTSLNGVSPHRGDHSPLEPLHKAETSQIENILAVAPEAENPDEEVIDNAIDALVQGGMEEADILIFLGLNDLRDPTAREILARIRESVAQRHGAEMSQ